MTEPKIVDAGFTLAGNYPEADPAAGLEETLQLFEFAEDIGLQVAGIRQRHPDPVERTLRRRCG